MGSNTIMYTRAHSEQLEGDVIQVLHAKPNGWVLIELKDRASGRNARVTGVAPGVSAGEQIRAYGAWVDDSRFGRQFRSSTIKISPPASTRGLRAFLASGAISGVGEAYADKLIDQFGDELIHVLDHNPERIRAVPGIGPARYALITTAWAKHHQNRELLMFLEGQGISGIKAQQIITHFGDQSLGIVRSSPYRLIEVKGFGFITVDGIARHLGVAADDPQRLRAGLVHTLETAALYGHCALPPARAYEQGAKLLQCSAAALAAQGAAQEEEGGLARRQVGDEDLLYLPRLDQAEARVAAWVRERLDAAPAWYLDGLADSAAAISRAEGRCGLTLSPSQREAVELALHHGMVIITGGPGCGKTTTTRVIIEVLQQYGAKILLAAPTGRAAKRLATATGRDASTIHRLLWTNSQSEGGLFADVVLIDEASMVDVELMAWLLDALAPTTTLLLVGDADQLPSVGPGRVFDDLIASGMLPVATLREVHRQAADSHIIQAAHAIRAGRLPAVGESREYVALAVPTSADIAACVEEWVCERLPSEFGFHPLRQIQVLSPMKRGAAGTVELNARLQHRLNPNTPHGITWNNRRFAHGDKVIATANDYEKEVFNGDTGFIRDIDTQADLLTIEFDGRPVTYTFRETDSLLLAYALTVHKSQGSEYDAVIIALAREHYPLLSRPLLYTAITRGKRFGAIFYEDGALELGLQSHKDPRITGLRHRC